MPKESTHTQWQRLNPEVYEVWQQLVDLKTHGVSTVRENLRVAVRSLEQGAADGLDRERIDMWVDALTKRLAWASATKINMLLVCSGICTVLVALRTLTAGLGQCFADVVGTVYVAEICENALCIVRKNFPFVKVVAVAQSGCKERANFDGDVFYICDADVKNLEPLSFCLLSPECNEMSGVNAWRKGIRGDAVMHATARVWNSVQAQCLL